MESNKIPPVILDRITLKDGSIHYAEGGLAMAGAHKICRGMFLDDKDLEQIAFDAWQDGAWAVAVPGSVYMTHQFHDYWKKRK